MKTYTDSAAVAMMLEFNNWNIANKAITKVGYTWQKQSFYLWITPQETRELAKSLGLNHPYKLRMYIEDETNTEPEIKEILNRLKIKLQENNLTDYDENSRKSLLKCAFIHNPEKIAYFKKKRAERNKGK